MSNQNNGAGVAPALAPVNQREIFLKFNDKKDSAPRLNSVLGAVSAFVRAEIKRKNDDTARALLDDAQRQTFDLGAWTYKEFFEERGIPGFPTPNGYQAEAATINGAWDAVAAKSIKIFVKKLKEVGEVRDFKVVYGEVMETYRNDATNKYRDLLG